MLRKLSFSLISQVALTIFRMSRSKYWCLTINSAAQCYGALNTVEGWETFRDDNKFTYIAAQQEIGDAGNHHVQAYVEWGGAQGLRFNQVRDLFPGAHVAARRGTALEAAAYCKDPEKRAPGGWLFEWGDISAPQPGKRNDLELIRDMVQQGADWVEIVAVVPQALRYSKEIRMYRAALKEKIPHEPENILLKSWQEEFFTLLDGAPTTRRIFWIWSPHSAVGKTTTMRYYMDTRPGTTLVGAMKLSDLMHAYDERHRVIWFDLSRSEPLDAEATAILEKLSNGGYVFSGKYESTQKRVSAHIVVTCNRAPPFERLPARLVEYHLNDQGNRIVEVEVGDENPNPNVWANPDFVLD